jgi:hypothetical protein
LISLMARSAAIVVQCSRVDLSPFNPPGALPRRDIAHLAPAGPIQHKGWNLG